MSRRMHRSGQCGFSLMDAIVRTMARAPVLICLGLGAFVSPAAAQVFDGFPFKGAVFTRGLLEMNGGVTDSYNSDLGPYNPATAGNNGDIASNNTILLSSGTTVQGGSNLTLTAPPIKYYFSEVVISGGSTLTVNGGGQQVQIWIDNKLTLSGGGVLNTDAKAPLLGWWACGSNTSTWTISGGSNAYFL